LKPLIDLWWNFYEGRSPDITALPNPAPLP